MLSKNDRVIEANSDAAAARGGIFLRQSAIEDKRCIVFTLCTGFW